jgi:hypothetical protein
VAVNNLREWLLETTGPEEVVEAICQRLHAWHNGQDLIPLNIPIIEAQDKIGWRSFLEGRVSLSWRLHQASFYASTKSRCSPKRWVTSLIIKLWDVAWDLWQFRNRIVHEGDEG